VLDADAGAAQPIATFEAEQLVAMLQPLGGKTLSDPKERLVIADGQSAIAFVSIAFAHNSHIPGRLLHRVSTADSAAEGAIIATHHTELHLLGPPVEGANWHLHFEVTTSSKLAAGHGVPYLIDWYRCMSTSDEPMELRVHELPLGNSLVEFGDEHGE
jgi:hypothetical protein